MKFLSLLALLLLPAAAQADAPVIWKGTTAQWLPSGMHSAGLEKTDALGVVTPYTTNGLVKMSSGVPGAAVSGTDFAPATSGSAMLKGNGSGGFSNAVSGTDYAPATSGSAMLKGDGAGGFSSAVSGTDYAPATATTSVLKGNGAGGFSAAASTDLTDTANIDLLNGIQTISAAKTFSSAPTFSSLTAKSVPFLGTGGLVSEDNTGFQYDGTNHRLGLGVTPAVTLDIKGNATDTQPTIQLTASNGNGPTKITTVTSGAMVMQNNAKNILQSDTTGHVSLVAGAANGPANLDSVIAQNQASETTHNTYAAQGIASQTGDLFTGYASGSSTKLFSITIAGKGSFSNLQDTAIGTAGLGRWDASGNLVSASELSGDVTTSGSNAVTIANSAVTNAKMANMANATTKCRTTAGTGAPEDCTATQETALLNAMVGDSGSGGTKGLVPAPASGDAAAGKFLKADGTWVAPSGGSVLQSYAFFDTPSGYGSTNTNVRLYTNTNTNGSDLTCANSATLGSSCTVNTTGNYCVSVSDLRTGGGGNIGIGIDTTTHSANGSAGTFPVGEYVFGFAGGDYGGGMVCFYLVANRVIRALSQSVEANGTSVGSRMTITRVN